LLEHARSKVRDLGLVDNVSFPGLIIDRAEIFRHLRRASIFMFCHRTPESPRCLIEALVSGTPIVGHDSGFPRDLIGAHRGGVLTEHNPLFLANAVAELHSDRARLADLMIRAAKDGHPFSDEEVFRNRSDIIKKLTA
jgi:glycosyltransferase involved in cell wall biosynthesis